MKNGMNEQEYRVVLGHSDKGVTKLIWYVLSLLSGIMVSEAAWLGSRFVELSNQVAALDAKVTIILTKEFGEKKP